MPSPMLKKVGKISRYVPGQVIYVDLGDQTLGFKPNRLKLRASDGQIEPYRGEPFSDLELGIGRRVSIIEDEKTDEQLDPWSSCYLLLDRSQGYRRIVRKLFRK